MDQEQVAFEIDPRSVTAALANMNRAVEGFEKGASGANERLNASFQRVSDILLKLNDRSRNSMENLTRSIEKQAAAYGKTGVEKLIAQRDAYIKRLGDEEGLIKRVTAAYDKMIAAEGGEGKFKGFGEGIKNFVENPLNAAQGAATGLLEKLGPIGGVAAAGAVGLTAIAAAGYEAAKSLGEYGVRIRDVELRTGLNSKEAQQFAFAARAVGQDVSVVERLMRGLTMAIEDDSDAGQKARGVLTGMGVDIRAVKDGTIPTAELLEQLSAGLEKIPSQWERNKVALDLFKKSGIEAIPFILELNKNLRESEGIHFASEADIARFQRYQTEVAKIGTEWDQLALKLKEPLAAVVLVTVKALERGDLSGPRPGETGTAGRYGPGAFAGVIEAAVRSATGTPEPTLNTLGDIQNKFGSALRPPGLEGPTSLDLRLNSDRGLEAEERRLADLKKQYDLVRGAARDEFLKEPTPANEQKIVREVDNARVAYERQAEVVKGLQRAESERLSNAEALDKLQKEAAQRSATPYKLLPFEAELAEFQRRPGLTRAQSAQAAQIMAPAIAQERNDALDRAIAAQAAEFKKLQEEHFQVPSQNDAKYIEEFRAGIQRGQKERQESNAALSGILAEDRALRQAREEGEIRIQGLSDVTPEARLRTEEQLLASRKRFADEAYQHELDLAQAQHQFDGQLEDAKAELRMKHAREVSGLEIELSEKVAEEQRRQFDEIKSTAEGLWRTLFTKPAEFGRQLGSTIRDALLKPVTEGLANITAAAIKPIIYGANGEGGIAGGFKNLFSSQDNPVKISTDLNTTATLQNSAAMVALTGVLSAGLSVASVIPSNPLPSPTSLSSAIGLAAATPAPEAAQAEPAQPSISGLTAAIERSSRAAAPVPAPTPATPQGLAAPPPPTSPAAIGVSAGTPAPEETAPAREAPPFDFSGLAAAIDRSSRTVPAAPAPAAATAAAQGLSAAPPVTPPPAIGLAAVTPAPVAPAPEVPVAQEAPAPTVPEAPAAPPPTAPAAPAGSSTTFGLTSSPLRSLQALLGGPGGTTGFVGPVSQSVPSGVPASGRQSQGGIPGFGGLLGPGGLAGLKGAVFNSNGISLGSGVMYGTQSGVLGNLAGIASSPLATSLGLGLGISGVQRGGFGGTLQGVLGGALAGFGIGAQIGAVGGPLGAAIGAGIGLTAGLISTFLFEPPWKEAQRLIKQLYRVDINRQMAQSIVDIAKQKYAGQVSIAVRDPDVRKMIELYAAGTNQQMPLSASTPRAGLLAETGGKLYQEAGYQYGRAYANPSSIPVLGPGGPLGTWPGPSTPAPAQAPNLTIQSLSLVVGDKGAGDFLAGQVTSDFVQDRWQAAANGSNGRTRNSALIQQPGLILS